jgi:hypothetical protein
MPLYALVRFHQQVSIKIPHRASMIIGRCSGDKLWILALSMTITEFLGGKRVHVVEEHINKSALKCAASTGPFKTLRWRTPSRTEGAGSTTNLIYVMRGKR